MRSLAKRNVNLAVFVIVIAVLQTTIFNHLKIYNVKPNILVIVAICFSLYEKSILSAALFGMICGVVLDAIGGGAFGVNAILCMYVSIASTVLSSRFFQGKVSVSLLFTCIFCLVYEVLLYTLCIYLWEKGDYTATMLDIILPTVLYNIILSVPLYFFMRRYQIAD